MTTSSRPLVLAAFALVCALSLSSPAAGQSGGSDCCNIDCQVSAWSDWGPCNATCGGGVQLRTRTVTVPQKDGGAACPALTDSQVCNTQACPTPFDCPVVPQDVLLLLDDTSQTTYSTTVLRSFFSTVVTDLFALNGTRVAITFFDSSSSAQTNFLQGLSLQLSALGNYGSFAGATRNIGALLKQVPSMLSSTAGRRANASAVVVLFTFGVSSDDATQFCNALKANGIELFLVGIDTVAPWFNDDSSVKARFAKSLAAPPLQVHFTPLNLTSVVGAPDPALSVVRKVQNDQTMGDSCTQLGTHISTFDGNLYSFPAYGEYFLTAPCGGRVSNDLVAQVRMLPCGCAGSSGTDSSGNVNAPPSGGITCASAYAFSDGTDVVEVGYQASLETLFVYLNGALQDRTSPVSTPSGTVVSILPRFLGGFDVVVQFATGHLALIFFTHANMGASVMLRPKLAAPLVGLCGRYDFCATNDFTLRDESMIVTSSNASDIYYSFGQSWRVAPTESLFTVTKGEQYFYDGWAPKLPDAAYPADSSYSVEAQQACFPLPDGALTSMCLWDVAASDRSAAVAYLDALYINCEEYCQTGLFRSSVFGASAAASQSLPHVFTTQCDQVCDYRFDYLYNTNPDSLHNKYNSSFLPPVDLRGADLPNSLFSFHPRLFRGGSYTFQRTSQRPDYCAASQDGPIAIKNVTVNIACLPLPTITAPSLGPVYFASYGFPLIMLNASLAYPAGTISAFQQNALLVSWNLIEYDAPEGFPVPAQMPRIRYPRALLARFIPNAPGLYTFEVAISDGCAVARKTLSVLVAQRCCTPDYLPGPVQASTWASGFPGRSLSLSGSSFVNFQVAPPAGSGAFSPPGLPYPLGDALRGQPEVYNQLQFNWGLLGHKNKTGPAVWIDSTEVITFQSTTEIIYNVTIPLTPTTSVNFTSSVTVNNSVVTNVTAGPYPTPDRLPAGSPLKTIVNFEAVFYAQSNVITTEFQQQNSSVIVPGTQRTCSVAINSPLSSSPVVSFTPPGGVPTGFSTIAQQCVGFYSFQSSVNVLGYSPFCAQNQTVDVAVNCPRRPVALVSCESIVMFNYTLRTFPSVKVVGAGSYDLSGLPLAYQWTFASAPPASQGPIILSGCTVRTPNCSFVPDASGSYSVSMGIANGCSAEYTTASVLALCGTPAQAIAPSPVKLTRSSQASPFPVALDASASTSPGTLVYSWTVLAGPAPAYFDNPLAAKPNLMVDAAGSYDVQVTVSDGCTSSSTTVQVVLTCSEVVNAIAGGPGTVKWDVLNFPSALLVGSSSSVAPSFPLAYHWSMISAPALSHGFPDGFNVNYTFTPDVAGVYNFSLTVSDGCVSAPAQVSVIAQCSAPPPPIAATVVLQPGVTTAYAASFFNLVASSTDPNYPLDWNVRGYMWAIQSAPVGSVATILFANQRVANFTPDVSGQYVFNVTAIDNCSQVVTKSSAPQPVVCYPSQASVAFNYTAVTFHDGAFPRVEVNGNKSVSGGQVSTAFSYIWQFIEAPPNSTYAPFTSITVTVVNSTVYSIIPNPDNSSTLLNISTLTVNTTVLNTTGYARLRPSASHNLREYPACFHPDVPGRYVLKFTLTDGCQTTSDLLTVDANCNTPPVASAVVVPFSNASAAYTVSEDANTVVVLDGSASSDVDGSDEITYYWYWAQSPLNGEQIINANEPVAQFVATVPGVYSVALVVNDGCQNSTAINLTIPVGSTCVGTVAAASDTITTAYDYLHSATSVSFCLNGEADTFSAGGAPGSWSTASDTTGPYGGVSANGLATINGGSSDYLESTALSTLGNTYTQLQCDALYTWALVDYSETAPQPAADPCTGDNANNWYCGSVPTTAASKSGDDTSGSDPVTKKGWFIAVIVLIVIGAVAGAAYWFYRTRRPSSGGSPKPGRQARYADMDNGEHNDQQGQYQPPEPQPAAETPPV